MCDVTLFPDTQRSGSLITCTLARHHHLPSFTFSNSLHHFIHPSLHHLHNAYTFWFARNHICLCHSCACQFIRSHCWEIKIEGKDRYLFSNAKKCNKHTLFVKELKRTCSTKQNGRHVDVLIRLPKGLNAESLMEPNIQIKTVGTWNMFHKDCTNIYGHSIL